MNPNTSLQDELQNYETQPMGDVIPDLLVPLYFYRCHSAWKSNELDYVLQEQNTSTTCLIDLSEDYSSDNLDSNRNHIQDVLVDDTDVNLTQISISSAQSKLMPKKSTKVMIDYSCDYLDDGIWVATFEEIKTKDNEKEFGVINFDISINIEDIKDLIFIDNQNEIKVSFNNIDITFNNLQEFMSWNNCVIKNENNIITLYLNKIDGIVIKEYILDGVDINTPFILKYFGTEKKLSEYDIYAVDGIKRNMLRQMEYDNEEFNFELIEVTLINWESYSVQNTKSLLLQLGTQFEDEDILESIELYIPNETLIGTIESRQQEKRVDYNALFWPMKISPIQVDESKVLLYFDWLTDKSVSWSQALPFLNPNNPNQHSLTEILYLSEQDLQITTQTIQKARIKNTMNFKWNIIGKNSGSATFGPSEFWKANISTDFWGKTFTAQTEHYPQTNKISIFDGNNNKQSLQGWDQGNSWFDGAMIAPVLLDDTFGFIQLEVWENDNWVTRTYQNARIKSCAIECSSTSNSSFKDKIYWRRNEDIQLTYDYVVEGGPVYRKIEFTTQKSLLCSYFTEGEGSQDWKDNWTGKIFNNFNNVFMLVYGWEADLTTKKTIQLDTWSVRDNGVKSSQFQFQFSKNDNKDETIVLEIGTNNKVNSLSLAVRKMLDWTACLNENFLDANYDSGAMAQNGMAAVKSQFVSNSNIKPEEIIGNIVNSLIHTLQTQETSPSSSIIYDSKWPILIGCINMLSDKIYSTYSINKGLNDDGRKYLPWTFDLFQTAQFTNQIDLPEEQWTWTYGKYKQDDGSTKKQPILDGSTFDFPDLYCGLKSYYFKLDQQYPTPQPIFNDISNPITIRGDNTGTLFTWPIIKDSIDEVSISTVSDSIQLGIEDYQKYMVYTTQDCTMLYGNNNVGIMDREQWSYTLPIQQNYARLLLTPQYPENDFKIDRLIIRGIWGGPSYAFIKTTTNKILKIQFNLFNNVDESISMTKLQF